MAQRPALRLGRAMFGRRVLVVESMPAPVKVVGQRAVEIVHMGRCGAPEGPPWIRYAIIWVRSSCGG